MSDTAQTNPASLNPPLVPEGAARPAWRLDWLTPLWCRVILAAVLVLVVVSRVIYLNSPGAIGLAPDEAQYWVWSQHLDWSYYSKGPMVAVLIRISTDLFGDTMQGVRAAALAISVVMSLMNYWLTRKLFGSERLALGSVLLTAFVPMYIAGSMIMTIDPPFVMFWAAATCLFVKATMDGSKWAWPASGMMVGCSFLAKYSAFLIFLGLVTALAADREWRRKLLSPGPYVSLLVAGLCTFPVIYWNWKNGWVSAAHVKADTTSGFNWESPLEYIGGTIGVVGPGLAVILVATMWMVFRVWGDPARAAARGVDGEHARRARFIVLLALPYFLIVSSTCLYTNAQLNWTAPAWFTFLIAGAWFLSSKLRSAETWKPWRGWFWGAVVTVGVVLTPIAHNVSVMYPVYAWIHKNVMDRTTRTLQYEATRGSLTPEQRAREISVRRWDPTARLRGWPELAADLDQRRRALLGDDAFFLLDDYTEASAVEFYAPGNPKTYVMGVYVEDPARRGRSSQWNMWPDRSLERGKTQLIGRNAIYIGTLWKAHREAFERIERLPNHQIVLTVRGVDYYLGGYQVYACYGFKGFVRPTDGKASW